nr:hypothetical protein [Candidatus Accumulibacter phosphatis]
MPYPFDDKDRTADCCDVPPDRSGSISADLWSMQFLPTGVQRDFRHHTPGFAQVGLRRKRRMESTDGLLTMAQAKEQASEVIPSTSQCRSAGARRASALGRSLQVVEIWRIALWRLAGCRGEYLHGLRSAPGPVIY